MVFAGTDACADGIFAYCRELRMEKLTPPSKRQRAQQSVLEERSKRGSATVPARTGAENIEPTPVMTSRRKLTIAASIPSTVSATTRFPAAALADSSNLHPRQRLDETTSPRLDSKLARRPTQQFPCALQPFRVVPPSPGDCSGVTVAEANRRIQQAQVLSARQQHFDQLIDLASTGYIPARECGQAQAPADLPLQPIVAAPQAIGQHSGEATAAENSQPPAQQVAAASAITRPLRLRSRSGVTMMPSLTGRGCIRILRLE